MNRTKIYNTITTVITTILLTTLANAKNTFDTTDFETLWRNATPEERVKISEQIGEYGARMKAKEQGLTPIFDGSIGKTIPQGPDQVYFNPKTGEVHVFECKANSSPLNFGYGYKQGTVEHTIKSAEAILNNPKASPLQKESARRIINAAAEGKLKISTVRTQHQLGKIVNVIIENTQSSQPNTIKMAQDILRSTSANNGINPNPSSNNKMKTPPSTTPQNHTNPNYIKNNSLPNKSNNPIPKNIPPNTNPYVKPVNPTPKNSLPRIKPLTQPSPSIVPKSVPKSLPKSSPSITNQLFRIMKYLKPFVRVF